MNLICILKNLRISESEALRIKCRWKWFMSIIPKGLTNHFIEQFVGIENLMIGFFISSKIVFVSNVWRWYPFSLDRLIRKIGHLILYVSLHFSSFSIILMGTHDGLRLSNTTMPGNLEDRRGWSSKRDDPWLSSFCTLLACACCRNRSFKDDNFDLLCSLFIRLIIGVSLS